MKPSTDPDAYFAIALPYDAGSDPAHDAMHIRRIVARLDRLMPDGATVDRALMAFVAAFHGLHRRLAAEPTFAEEVAGRLRDLGWEDDALARAFAALARHTSNPRTIEEQVVHDANLVEVLGAFGVAKAFTKGGAEGQSYEETAAILRANVERAEFHTPEGRRLAEAGRRYVQGFLDDLEAQLH